MEMELAWVSDESGREFKLVPKDLVTEADAAAKAACIPALGWPG